MQFSKKTKDELARFLPSRRCCQVAELAALIRADGMIQICGRYRFALSVNTENAAVARKIFLLCKTLFALHADIMVQRGIHLRKNNIYVVRVAPQPQLEQMLRQLGVMGENYELPEQIDNTLLNKQCCRRAYLRGAFLGGGSVNSPEKEYHLEIVAVSLAYGRQLQEIMQGFELPAKSCERKGSCVIYLKEADAIAAFLNIAGAHNALLQFEDVRVLKGVKNRVNRLVNCDTANLNKTVEAAVEQLENIKLINRKIGFDSLPRGLTETAQLRFEYPEASLKELAELHQPPVSKSCINHRMRKLAELARELREGIGLLTISDMSNIMEK